MYTLPSTRCILMVIKTTGWLVHVVRKFYVPFRWTKLLPHLSVHLVNRLLREKLKSIPNVFNGKKKKKKKRFKNVTLQILKFILKS